MSTNGQGLSPAALAQSQLDDLYGSSGKSADKVDQFKQIARKTKVPINLLMALDDGAGNMGRAEGIARRLASQIEQGNTIEQALADFTGDQASAQTVLAKAYDIADQIAPPAPASADRGNDGRVGFGEAVGGLGRDFATGAVRATGGAIEALGVAADETLRYGADRIEDRPTVARGAGRAAGDLVRGAGDGIADGRSQDYKAMREGTQISGELNDPSSWSLGENPSLLGAAGVMAEGLGSMAPLVAAPQARIAAAMGGLMGAGEGVENGRKFVQDAAKLIDENGQPEIAKMPEYKALIEGGASHEKAVEDLTRRAENNAGFRQGLFASVGGAATNRIMRGAEGWIGQGGRLTRAVKKGGAGGLEEGVQETAEGAASQTGIEAATGADLNVMEDSFGNFVAGALTGAGMGAAAGAIGKGEAAPASEDDAPLGLRTPAIAPALPSPENGGTIFMEGSTDPAPTDPAAPAPAAPAAYPFSDSGLGALSNPAPAPAPTPAAVHPRDAAMPQGESALRATIDRAHEVGAVLDDELIIKGHAKRCSRRDGATDEAGRDDWQVITKLGRTLTEPRGMPVALRFCT